MGLSGADLTRLGPAAQRQILQKMGDAAAKENKFHNEKAVRIMPNGKEHIFDSQKEARRYDQLTILLKAGQIRKLKLQEQFTLQESYITPEGDRIRAIRYVADFTYERPTKPDQNGTVYWLPVVEDAKGVQTRDYKNKKKLMRERFNITIQEV